MGPVQTMSHHGVVVPVEGIDDARRAIDVPAVSAVLLEELLRIGRQPARREHPGLDPRRFEVQQQPRPLETVARGGAVRAEAVSGVVVVVLAQRLPVAVEVFDDHVAVSCCMTMNHPLDDALRAHQPALIFSDIGQREERFGGVHVAVGAAIGLFVAPVAIEEFAHGALFFAPEIRVDDVDRIIQQRLGAGTLCDHRRAGRERDKGMQIGILAGVAVAMFGDRKPAAVQRIPQWTTQGRNAVINQFGKPRQALNVGHGEAVGHARGVHGFGLRVRRQTAAFVEVAETFRQLCSLGECQQAQTFVGEPLLVGRGVQPTAEAWVEKIHEWPFLLL